VREGRGRRVPTTERVMRKHFWFAVLTDSQFWVPVVVLALGTGLLLALR
jgi:hypothetical protein